MSELGEERHTPEAEALGTSEAKQRQEKLQQQEQILAA
jgi:hypothetical protein